MDDDIGSIKKTLELLTQYMAQSSGNSGAHLSPNANGPPVGCSTHHVERPGGSYDRSTSKDTSTQWNGAFGTSSTFERCNITNAPGSNIYIVTGNPEISHETTSNHPRSGKSTAKPESSPSAMFSATGYGEASGQDVFNSRQEGTLGYQSTTRISGQFDYRQSTSLGVRGPLNRQLVETFDRAPRKAHSLPITFPDPHQQPYWLATPLHDSPQQRSSVPETLLHPLQRQSTATTTLHDALQQPPTVPDESSTSMVKLELSRNGKDGINNGNHPRQVGFVEVQRWRRRVKLKLKPAVFLLLIWVILRDGPPPSQGRP
ncbi:hypothetical protein BJ508DRAFT_329976 [Ascobolus immersus RN42]|uniref:Uncharacterized protein n=1 Tax=Ascobolus immersus RN42 TaxID=1160509 RepID=A0A3N4HX78_ASCIM|nr:hypothetical protein BJ508DRAFT_329976 [Ascobolus immersus RN42]